MLLVASGLQCSVARIWTRSASGVSVPPEGGGVDRSCMRPVFADGNGNPRIGRAASSSDPPAVEEISQRQEQRFGKIVFRKPRDLGQLVLGSDVRFSAHVLGLEPERDVVLAIGFEDVVRHSHESGDTHPYTRFLLRLAGRADRRLLAEIEVSPGR